MSDKTILEQWRAMAYNQQEDRNKLQRFWANYFNSQRHCKRTGRKIRTGRYDDGRIPGRHQRQPESS